MLEAGGSPATSASLLNRVLAAVFYGCSSCFIMIINKSLLTVYNFPSCQALSIGIGILQSESSLRLPPSPAGQMLATLVVLYTGKLLGTVSFPDVSRASFSQVWPLPLFYLGNLVFGLEGTQALSLPMLTVLRRFSILMTMIGQSEVSFSVSLTVRFCPGEYYILQRRHKTSVRVSVLLMIFGATVAAFNDLAFNIKGWDYRISLLLYS